VASAFIGTSRVCTSSGDAAGALIAVSRPTLIAVKAWLVSSCSSRAILRRSSSCAVMILCSSICCVFLFSRSVRYRSAFCSAIPTWVPIDVNNARSTSGSLCPSEDMSDSSPSMWPFADRGMQTNRLLHPRASSSIALSRGTASGTVVAKAWPSSAHRAMTRWAGGHVQRHAGSPADVWCDATPCTSCPSRRQIQPLSIPASSMTLSRAVSTVLWTLMDWARVRFRLFSAERSRFASMSSWRDASNSLLRSETNRSSSLFQVLISSRDDFKRARIISNASPSRPTSAGPRSGSGTSSFPSAISLHAFVSPRNGFTRWRASSTVAAPTAAKVSAPTRSSLWPRASVGRNASLRDWRTAMPQGAMDSGANATRSSVFPPTICASWQL